MVQVWEQLVGQEEVGEAEVAIAVVVIAGVGEDPQQSCGQRVIQNFRQIGAHVGGVAGAAGAAQLGPIQPVDASEYGEG